MNAQIPQTAALLPFVLIALLIIGAVASTTVEAQQEPDTSQTALAGTALLLRRGNGVALSEQRKEEQFRPEHVGPHTFVRANQLKDAVLEIDEPHGVVVIKYGDKDSNKQMTIFPDNTVAITHNGKMIFAEVNDRPK